MKKNKLFSTVLTAILVTPFCANASDGPKPPASVDLSCAITGIVATQTARLNVAYTGQSGKPATVTLRFLDVNGEVILEDKAKEIDPGASASLDLRGDNTEPLLAFDSTKRAEIRAVVSTNPKNTNRLIISQEVFDTATGVTAVNACR